MSDGATCLANVNSGELTQVSSAAAHTWHLRKECQHKNLNYKYNCKLRGNVFPTASLLKSFKAKFKLFIFFQVPYYNYCWLQKSACLALCLQLPAVSSSDSNIWQGSKTSADLPLTQKVKQAKGKDRTESIIF